jgi:hypothetical protein
MAYRRPNEKRITSLGKWAHRHGIARSLNAVRSSEIGLISEYVETVVPLQLLALYAARYHGVRVHSVEQVGFLRRRWNLRPR